MKTRTFGMKRTCLAALTVLTFAAQAAYAQTAVMPQFATAQTCTPNATASTVTVYSNVDDDSFTGEGTNNDGAASGAGPTDLVADDIAPITGYTGDAVTSLSFSFLNFNAEDVTASPTLSIFSGNGADGGPGTLLATIRFTAITEPGQSFDIYTATKAAGFFQLPSDYFWAGLSFSSTTATQAELNNLGQALYDPPTVGSSEDAFVASDNPDTFTSNPAGGIYQFSDGTPANFAFAFSVTPPAAAPDPSQFAAFAVGLLGLGALAMKAKKRVA